MQTCVPALRQESSPTSFVVHEVKHREQNQVHVYLSVEMKLIYSTITRSALAQFWALYLVTNNPTALFVRIAVLTLASWPNYRSGINILPTTFSPAVCYTQFFTSCSACCVNVAVSQRGGACTALVNKNDMILMFTGAGKALWDPFG